MSAGPRGPTAGPPEPFAEHGPALNTDRELWRERDGDFYAPSVFVTASGGIGVNVGGTVFVKPIRGWFALAEAQRAPPAGLTVEEHGRLNGTIDALRDQLRETQDLLAQWQRNAALAVEARKSSGAPAAAPRDWEEAVASRDSLLDIQRAQIRQLSAECERLRAAAARDGPA